MGSYAATMELVSAPLHPAQNPELARQPFAFWPEIAGLEHNEWLLRRSGWGEIVAVNAKTAHEILVPRRFLAGLFDEEDGTATAALTEPLEYRRGRVVPVRRGVIAMPSSQHRPVPAWKRSQRPASVVAIRTDPPRPSWIARTLKGTLALGFVACLAGVFLLRDAHLAKVLGWTTSAPSSLPLTAGDDYFSVVNKLGHPASDRWIETRDGGGIRRLVYPRRRLAVILSGETRDTAVYLRTFGRDGSVVHAAASGER